MENYHSYADFMKAMSQSKRMTEAEKLLNDIYLDLFLKHVHRSQLEAHLMKKIDDALDTRNEAAFTKYVAELQTLQSEDENE